MFLDSGSTHNFIVAKATKYLQIQVQHQPALHVALPDGGKMASNGVSRNLHMMIHGYEFSANFFSIPLEGFDIILGIHWLKSSGPILWDFRVRKMVFKVNNRLIKWHCESPEPIALTALGASGYLAPDFDDLLGSFADIFEKPQGLPPTRPCDHQIRLYNGTEPIAVCPYRYPHLFKDEIEKQCEEMLQNGTIRSNKSPFSSLVLLVKKHDGLWRFCIDYRELNSKMVKVKFPIPVVEELLGELHGATFFFNVRFGLKLPPGSQGSH